MKYSKSETGIFAAGFFLFFPLNGLLRTNTWFKYTAYKLTGFDWPFEYLRNDIEKLSSSWHRNVTPKSLFLQYLRCRSTLHIKWTGWHLTSDIVISLLLQIHSHCFTCFALTHLKILKLTTSKVDVNLLPHLKLVHKKLISRHTQWNATIQFSEVACIFLIEQRNKYGHNFVSKHSSLRSICSLQQPCLSCLKHSRWTRY